MSRCDERPALEQSVQRVRASRGEDGAHEVKPKQAGEKATANKTAAKKSAPGKPRKGS
ncbi:hypothetical protein [Streptomyces spectabilis]|uniref:hypothetical protein n=1 Tax=Streptomyces spectabilis TaxID=68270 RepID=UPI001376FEF7|nr:hypothetical protein [Streptomyces spectabilis]